MLANALRVADLIAERLGARARTANGRPARVSCPS
jgi:hypothetical protein